MRNGAESAGKLKAMDHKCTSSETARRQLAKQLQTVLEARDRIDVQLASYKIVKRELDAVGEERDLLEQKVKILSGMHCSSQQLVCRLGTLLQGSAFNL